MVRYGLVLLFALAAIACHAGDGQRQSGRAVQTAVGNDPHARGGAMTVSEAPATQLVRRLIESRPGRMSELEAIVGPIAMSFRDEDRENMGRLDRPRDGRGEFTALVPRLHVRYRFDMYHETRTRQRDVGLETYTLDVRGDAAIVEQLLRGKLGAPRTVVDGSIKYAAYHPFYVARDAGAADRFRLVWHAEVPRFAIPEPDPQARAAWLRQLGGRIEIAKSIDEIDAFCKAAPADAGIEIVGTLNRTANPYGLPAKDPRDYWIKLVPPVRATVLAAAFGWGTIVGVSHDVHMSSWHVERRDDSWLPISGADAQWEIRASFTTIPHGGHVKRAGRGHDSAHGVAADDEIDSLAISPRFK